ncbi:MAG TPA: formate dehydrogenase accessory protein FdhE [Gammaproteobacteria bacterium]
MRRVLERGQIEALAGQDLPRVRLPEPSTLFAARAARLRELAGEGAIGRSIADYLRLMASLADAQHRVLEGFAPKALPGDAGLARAREHGMPVLDDDALRGREWQDVLVRLCDALETAAAAPASVRQVLARLRAAPADALDRQADAILGGRSAEVDVAAAPFVMGALQVRLAALASRLPREAVEGAGAPGVCPVCGTLPVASVVREDRESQGRRFLHCALCATEWYLVRVTCSHCHSTQGISYRSIEGGPAAIRAECCDGCRTYRKILYQEEDERVEAVADDLASLALDLLLAEAGFHRAIGNPLLWTGAG